MLITHLHTQAHRHRHRHRKETDKEAPVLVQTRTWEKTWIRHSRRRPWTGAPTRRTDADTKKSHTRSDAPKKLEHERTRHPRETATALLSGDTGWCGDRDSTDRKEQGYQGNDIFTHAHDTNTTNERGGRRHSPTKTNKPTNNHGKRGVTTPQKNLV